MKKILIATLAFAFITTTANARVSCKSFKTQAEAQAYFETHHAKALDRDHDGIACENNAGGKSHKSSRTKKQTSKTRVTKPSAKVTESSNPFK